MAPRVTFSRVLGTGGPREAYEYNVLDGDVLVGTVYKTGARQWEYRIEGVPVAGWPYPVYPAWGEGTTLQEAQVKAEAAYLEVRSAADSHQRYVAEHGPIEAPRPQD